jgi:acyl-CoA synthetase (AMP-forming)/AMP-acid ligase II
MVVPTMLARIVEHLGDAAADTPTLAAVAYGGARMPRPVLEAALRAFPNAGFVNAYGLTETSSTIAVLDPDDHRAGVSSDDPGVRARLGSAGRFVPGVEGQVRADDGTVLGPGEVGELFVRGAQVSGTYLGSGSVLDADGWFPTRDRASIDAEGYLFIEGRSDDTIIRGGENIAPAEIEDVLCHHPDIRDVAVVGLPDEEWGERIVAAIVLHPGASLDSDNVRSYARERLRGSRTPDDVVAVDELPYNPTGKLVRKDLVNQLLAERH